MYQCIKEKAGQNNQLNPGPRDERPESPNHPKRGTRVDPKDYTNRGKVRWFCLRFSDLELIADGSRPFCYRDSVDDFGAALELEQPDDSVGPIVNLSRATFDSERHCGAHSARIEAELPGP